MNADIQAAIVRECPRVCCMCGASPRDSCMARGFAVGDGWTDIVYTMCRQLEALPLPPKLAQVKEKFGTLRVYVDHRPAGGVRWWGWPLVPFVAARFLLRYGFGSRRGWRWVVHCAWEYAATALWRVTDDEMQWGRQNWAAADAIIYEAERASETVCEDCGAPGKLRDGGWLRTLCDRCARG